MFNVLLDALPTEYNGYKIDTDFQIWVQITQMLDSSEYSDWEKVDTALELMYLDKDEKGNPLPLPDYKTAVEGLLWFLLGWQTDNPVEDKKARCMDYDKDQWRIYSAFRAQYGINLNTDKLHYWEFMALMTTLEECAYTRVIDIRNKNLKNVDKDYRAEYAKLKERYAIESTEKEEYTAEERAAIDSFEKIIRQQKEEMKKQKVLEQAFIEANK